MASAGPNWGTDPSVAFECSRVENVGRAGRGLLAHFHSQRRAENPIVSPKRSRHSMNRRLLPSCESNKSNPTLPLQLQQTVIENSRSQHRPVFLQ